MNGKSIICMYFWKHFSKKSFASADRCSGMGGWDLVDPMWKRAETWKKEKFEWNHFNEQIQRDQLEELYYFN